MKRIQIIAVLLVLSLITKAQVTMQINLPTTMPVNSELPFEVKIMKGTLANFSKYQLEVPKDITIQEVDSKSGTFTFEDNTVKIIWVMTPQEPELQLKLKLISGAEKGQKTLIQKYFYIENDNKRQVEMENAVISVSDSSGMQASSVDFYTLQPKTPASIITSSINPDEISTKRPEVLIQQVAQLHKDAKDARVVGDRKKKDAELAISTANEAITTAASISSEEERKIALEKANADKQKAEKDLEIAERVLQLAQSLDDNANEIERINKAVNPASFNGQAQAPTVAAANQPNAVKESKEGTTVNIDKLDEVFGPPEGKTKGKATNGGTESATEDESGIVYKIQLGAFSKKPNKSDFKAVGKVKITEESAMYKVLYGSFKVKEDAIQERKKIIAKGFDCFVVTYQNGSRQK